MKAGLAEVPKLPSDGAKARAAEVKPKTGENSAHTSDVFAQLFAAVTAGGVPPAKSGPNPADHLREALKILKELPTDDLTPEQQEVIFGAVQALLQQLGQPQAQLNGPANETIQKPVIASRENRIPHPETSARLLAVLERTIHQLEEISAKAIDGVKGNAAALSKTGDLAGALALPEQPEAIFKQLTDFVQRLSAEQQLADRPRPFRQLPRLQEIASPVPGKERPVQKPVDVSVPVAETASVKPAEASQQKAPAAAMEQQPEISQSPETEQARAAAMSAKAGQPLETEQSLKTSESPETNRSSEANEPQEPSQSPKAIESSKVSRLPETDQPLEMTEPSEADQSLKAEATDSLEATQTPEADQSPAQNRGETVKAEPVLQRPLQAAAPPPVVRASQLTADLAPVLQESIRLTGNGESTQIKVSIFPEHLGHLDIRLASADGKVVAQIFTSSFAAKEMLDFQLNQLRTSLIQQGVTVDSLNVSYQQPNGFAGQHNSQPEPRSFRQPKPSATRGYGQGEEEQERRPRTAEGVMTVDYSV